MLTGAIKRRDRGSDWSCSLHGRPGKTRGSAAFPYVCQHSPVRRAGRELAGGRSPPASPGATLPTHRSRSARDAVRGRAGSRLPAPAAGNRLHAGAAEGLRRSAPS